jgi:hypothetical protein
MRDVYAAQYLLTAPNAFDLARATAAAWCLDRYPSGQRGDLDADFEAAPSPSDRIEWQTIAPPNRAQRAWSLTYRHVDHDDQTLGWRSLVQLTESEAGVRFTFRLSQESLEARVRPAIEVPGRPRIVRDLALQLGGRADARPILATASAARSDEMASLVDLLLDPHRRLPVVLTTVDPETGRPMTDPDLLAGHLIGVAHVFAVLTAPATFELTAMLGKSLSVFDGAVRIYWPGLTRMGDPYLHRLWLPRTVDLIERRAIEQGARDGFARHLLGLIGDVAALRIPPDPLVRSLRREAEAAARAAERTGWEQRAAEQGALADEFAADFDRQAKRIEELEFEVEVADERIAELEAEKSRILRGFADVQLAVARERGDEPEPAVTPTSIREALELVASEHPEALVVLEPALESAAETRYPQLDRAGAALKALGKVAQGWHDGSLGMGFEEAFREHGFELRSVSPVTQGRYPRDYGRTYRGSGSCSDRTWRWETEVRQTPSSGSTGISTRISARSWLATSGVISPIRRTDRHASTDRSR